MIGPFRIGAKGVLDVVGWDGGRIGLGGIRNGQVDRGEGRVESQSADDPTVRDSLPQAPHRGASFSPYCPQPPKQG